MTEKATAILREACAIIGTGLFAFGVWRIYEPAAFIFMGAFLSAPFYLSLRRPK